MMYSVDYAIIVCVIVLTSGKLYNTKYDGTFFFLLFWAPLWLTEAQEVPRLRVTEIKGLTKAEHLHVNNWGVIGAQ